MQRKIEAIEKLVLSIAVTRRGLSVPRPKKYHTEEERPEAIRQSQRKYREANREAARQRQRKYFEANREAINAAVERARKRRVAINAGQR